MRSSTDKSIGITLHECKAPISIRKVPHGGHGMLVTYSHPPCLRLSYTQSNGLYSDDVSSGERSSGIAPDVGPVKCEDEEPRKYHAYYQWVPFVLLLQGILFYTPHFLWKELEGRELDKITKGLRGMYDEFMSRVRYSNTKLE